MRRNATEELRIRPFEARDQSAGRRLILEGLGEHFGFVDESRNPDVDNIIENYMARNHAFVVAEVEHDLVGTGALMIKDECVGQIVRVSVSKRHRRRGIGRHMVEHLVDAARRRGLARLQVETNNDWIDAIRLYQHCGFQEYDRDAESVYLAL